MVYVNGTTLLIPSYRHSKHTVLQYCDFLKIPIPRFCYHDHLSLSGNCRLCLVESDNFIKPVLSCITDVDLFANLVIFTHSLLVKQAREYMLEFLLLNHPLDCPLCDQGGECDLQDMAMRDGSDNSKFFEEKRSSEPFSFGPLVSVVLTRCIQCTRCVRFFDEIIGSSFLGTTGRGSNNTVSTFFEQLPIGSSTVYRAGIPVLFFSSGILGNVIDVCPVGALTSNPSAYKFRHWEVVVTETLDVLDSLCSNIRIETVGCAIVRILPRLNALLNYE